MNSQYVSRVVDLTYPEKNVIYNMTHEEAVNVVKSGDVEAIRKIDGQFSLVSVEGKTIRMARSIVRPKRYSLKFAHTFFRERNRHGLFSRRSFVMIGSKKYCRTECFSKSDLEISFAKYGETE